MSDINHNSVEKVLKSFSHKKITESFSLIENKISKLINVTAEDFLKLNAKFKKYFKDIKNIAHQSAATFKDITSDSQTTHIKLLNENAKKYSDIIENVDYQIQKCYTILKSINKNFNIINLNVRNYKQNITTLKVLITNLKIVSVTNESKKGSEEIDKLLEQITEIHPCFEDNFSDSSRMYQNSIKTVDSLRHKIEYSKELLANFTDGILKSETKFNEALRILPILNENSNKCSNDLESIMTNLQFQDIVSQKIEHIKKTHNQIIEKLEEKDQNVKASAYQIEKAKRYVQISDVCGLQAAQLIHSNKEYQKALTTITTKFNEIGETIESIYGITLEFFENSLGDERLTINDLVKDLSSYKQFTKELSLVNNIFELQIESLISKSENIITCFNKIENFTKNLNEFNKTISDINQRSGAKRLSSNNLLQIKAITNELEGTANNLYAIKSDNQKLMMFLQKEFKDVYQRLNHEKSIQNINTNTEVQISNILDIYRNAYNILVNSLSNSSEIASNIKTTFDDVKYYDLFESETEGIISILGELSQQLHEEDKEALRELKEFENLKSNYTVDSEYEIHKQFTNNIDGNAESLFDDSLFTGNENTDDDNLELF